MDATTTDFIPGDTVLLNSGLRGTVVEPDAITKPDEIAVRFDGNCSHWGEQTKIADVQSWW